MIGMPKPVTEYPMITNSSLWVEYRLRAIEAAMRASPDNPGRWFDDAQRIMRYVLTGDEKAE